ncbi:MAG: tetratricopeptide repeat protein, partial [Acidobacteriota bacterium]
DAARSSAFIAWWATWPAEPVDGFMISDRVAYSLFGFVSNDPERQGATYPETYLDEIRPRLVDDGAITLDEIRKFVVVSPAQFAALRRQVQEDPKVAYREPVNHLTKILASARSYQAIALDILGRGQPDLFSIYYQGIDEVCHRFAHYMPPRMDMATAEEYAAYRDAVFAYYRYQDRLIGEILAKLSPDTVVLVVSDHGFQNGSSRPAKEPPYIEGKPGLWHRRYGILIAAGPGIRPGRLDTTSLLDIAPTVLYLAGMPVADDMQGRVIKEAIDDAFQARFPPRTLPSYEGVGRSLEQIRPVVAGSGADEEMVARLKSLGYVGGGQDAGGADGADGAGQALVTAHLNEAGLHAKNKDYARAQAAVAEALKINADFIPALLLTIQIEEGQKHFDRAIEVARQVIARHPEEEQGIYLVLGRLYKDGGRTREGIALYRQLAREHPGLPEIPAALGSLELKDGQTAAAEKDLLEALRLNPAQSEPLTELHIIYRDSPRILTLEPIVRKGLLINGKSVVHLNWLGLIHEWKKELPQAESAFKKAMEYDPDYAATMANLGALYGRNGRLPEAVAILRRAVAKDPENVESWVNLGAAQGRMGRSREAIEALETARGKGVRTTTLFNALALAYLQDRQPDKAKQYLKESLTIDPNQKDAKDLLEEVSRRS